MTIAAEKPSKHLITSSTEDVIESIDTELEIAARLEEAHRLSREGAIAECLLPAHFDTGWWHEYAPKACSVRFVTGQRVVLVFRPYRSR